MDAKLLEAVAFAARAHHGQMRKDRATPYVSHVFRVCLVLRDVFGVTDHRVLLGLKLHLGDRTLQQTDRAGATLDIMSPLANPTSPLMFAPQGGVEPTLAK